MITASWPRLVIGTLALIIGAATGLMAWSVATCDSGQAGSLWLGAATLILNILAWSLLGSRLPSKLVLLVALVPAICAISYTASTIQLGAGFLGDGLSACSVIKPGLPFGKDGREPLFIGLWLLACTSFWGGLAPVVLRAIRVHGGNSDGE